MFHHLLHESKFHLSYEYTSYLLEVHHRALQVELLQEQRELRILPQSNSSTVGLAASTFPTCGNGPENGFPDSKELFSNPATLLTSAGAGGKSSGIGSLAATVVGSIGLAS